MITEVKNVRLITITTNTQKVYEVILDSKCNCMTVLDDKGRKVKFKFNGGKLEDNILSLTRSDILEHVESPQTFNLKKTKQVTSALYDAIAFDLHINPIVKKATKQFINHINTLEPESFAKLCEVYFTKFCPEIINYLDQIINIRYDYSEHAYDIVSIILCDLCKMLSGEHSCIKKSPILCDVYMKNRTLKTPLNCRMIAAQRLYSWLYNSGILKVISFEYKEYDENVYFAFDTKHLKPYISDIKKSGIPDIDELLRWIFDSPTKCIYSGAIQPGDIMTTYREVDGCIGRSVECWYSSNLSNEAISWVLKERQVNGVKAAVSLLFTLTCFL